ncbi:MAG TPA: efflux RND transporter periplasmic adaptor subunit [Steroidobacteraceae bacterium]|jgi:membrane fusion protein, multidrug efflux system|nr:efflux RND transporter periplasmic adaptor subunit [Steroidobacteraceae bacterium]
MDAPATNAATTPDTRLQQRRRTWLIALTAGVVVVALLVTAWWWLYASRYEGTDDAYVAGDLANVMSQVSGTVISIGADENDRVLAGEELVKLDPTDTRIALQDAEQQLARTVRQVHTVFANRDQLRALVLERRADLDRALADFSRRKNLAASGAVSGEELGHARDAVNAARDALTAAQKNLAASVALVGRTGVADNPDVQAAATQVERAWLNLQRTTVRSPVSGYVARRGTELGERISPGNPLMSIVPLEHVWIDANFKEVQLRNMRIGQPVEVTADLYGGRVKYHGRVEGLGMGTGAAFALLPAQNATGNWIKVVQRLAVRIAMEPSELAEHPLRIGLSMHVTVDVHDASGSQLAPAPRREPVLTTSAYDTDLGAIGKRIAEIVRENSAAPVAPPVAATRGPQGK